MRQDEALLPFTGKAFLLQPSEEMYSIDTLTVIVVAKRNQIFQRFLCARWGEMPPVGRV